MTVDIHISRTSPCVGAGLTIAGITDDFDGDPRLDPPAIGADQPTAAPTPTPTATATSTATARASATPAPTPTATATFTPTPTPTEPHANADTYTHADTNTYSASRGRPCEGYCDAGKRRTG